MVPVEPRLEDILQRFGVAAPWLAAHRGPGLARLLSLSLLADTDEIILSCITDKEK